MGMEKTVFEFPEGDEGLEIEPSSALAIDEVGEVEKTTDEVDNELEIEIVDDTPKADQGRKKSDSPDEVTEEELKDYSDKVQKRIKHFSKGYHDERRDKEKAQRESDELATYAKTLLEENRKLKGTVGDNNTSMLASAKDTVAAETAIAEKEYLEAHEAGDSEELLKAQKKLHTAQFKADKLEQIKLPPLQEKPDGVKGDEVIPKRPTVDVRATEWAEENTWFGDDDEMTALALGFHQKLVKSGVDTQSNEYYEKLNSRMREVFPNSFADAPKEDERKAKPNVVASATRSASPRKVTLSKTQVAIAKKLGVPLKDYAREVAKEMRKEQ